MSQIQLPDFHELSKLITLFLFDFVHQSLLSRIKSIISFSKHLYRLKTVSSCHSNHKFTREK